MPKAESIGIKNLERDYELVAPISDEEYKRIVTIGDTLAHALWMARAGESGRSIG